MAQSGGSTLPLGNLLILFAIVAIMFYMHQTERLVFSENEVMLIFDKSRYEEALEVEKKNRERELQSKSSDCVDVAAPKTCKKVWNDSLLEHETPCASIARIGSNRVQCISSEDPNQNQKVITNDIFFGCTD